MVDCGEAMPGTTLRIVDPTTAQVLPEDSIGEIWLNGPSVARGYWNRPEENKTRFQTISPALTSQPAKRGLASWLPRLGSKQEEAANDDRLYFRTGDLGFLHDGHLYVTGRLKDLIIIRGRNYAPQDIEASVIQLGGEIENRVVAFPVEGPRSEGLGLLLKLLVQRVTNRCHRLYVIFAVQSLMNTRLIRARF